MVKDRLTALGLFGVSVLYLVGCLHLQVGTLRKPGAGFLPSFVGIALFFCSGLYLLRTFRRRPEGRSGPTETGAASNPRVIWGLLGSTLLYPFVLQPLNFVMATCLVVWAMLIITGYRNILVSLLVALVLALSCFVVFAMLLGVALPSGAVEQFLYGLRG